MPNLAVLEYRFLISFHICIFQEEGSCQEKLKEATWKLHLFRVSVAQSEYNNEKRQRITVRAAAPVDFATESRFLLEEISKIKASC